MSGWRRNKQRPHCGCSAGEAGLKEQEVEYTRNTCQSPLISFYILIQKLELISNFLSTPHPVPPPQSGGGEGGGGITRKEGEK